MESTLQLELRTGKSCHGFPETHHYRNFRLCGPLRLRMQQRRFTRHTDAFSKKLENHAAVADVCSGSKCEMAERRAKVRFLPQKRTQINAA